MAPFIPGVLSNTFNGSATGPRYSAYDNAVINYLAGSETSFPGSTAGILGNGGVYTASARVGVNNLLVQNGALFGPSNQHLIQDGGANRLNFAINNAGSATSYFDIQTNTAYASPMLDGPGGKLFLGASGSAQAYVDSYGFHGLSNILSSGTTPALSSCGTSPALGTNASSSTGSIRLGTGTVTACTLTFGQAYPSVSYCVLAPASNYTGTFYISSESATAFTVTFSTNAEGLTFNYWCSGS